MKYDVEVDSQGFWSLDVVHPDLIATKKLVYDPCQFKLTNPSIEFESIEYGAYEFKLNELSIKFRVAKVTPTKIGQFVTLWKRIGNSPICPYDLFDPIDFYVISVRNNNYFGQFVFHKSVLAEQGVLSINGECGKRAIRVYPPWDKVMNKQAEKTQSWQKKYFIEISENKFNDTKRFKNYYGIDLND